MEKIRNFCIIAHIDHGKSTLADRLIQACGAVEERRFQNQLLDTMDIERERGITIKSNTISMTYKARDGKNYHLNLIDTPGHVDFSHEVRRSLLASDGALIIVDASQGVEAQTVANLYLAMEHEVTLLPVINKIDLPSADVDRVREEIDEDLGLDPFEAIPVSATKGIGIDEVLEGIITKLPPPAGDPSAPLQALIFDAFFDPYRGVILLVRIREGTLVSGQAIRFMHAGTEHEVEELGLNRLGRVKGKELPAGSVGYVIAGNKTIRDVSVGDTITDAKRPAAEPIPGYKPARPVVFSSLYPMGTDEYESLTRALEKLSLNDAALVYEKDSSAALGFGYRCGFLGLLHLDVVQERLEREFGISLVLSAPSVLYRVTLDGGEELEVDNPVYWPDPAQIASVSEPYIKATIMVPATYMGGVMDLCRECRSTKLATGHLSANRVEVTSEMPLNEVLFDFYDRLKTITRGYGSFDWEELDYRPSNIAKVDILVNGEKVDALAYLVYRDKARARALHYCEQLADSIPRHLFKIAVQGAIGGKIIARSNVRAMGKNVTAKCYGGDITRKRKLLEKQKAGKKRMKLVGTVQIPQEAFVAVLRTKPER
jgi:GTP-binding protein LepA